MSFEWPWIFYLSPLPLIIYFLVPRAKTQQSALKVPSLSRFQDGQASSVQLTSALKNLRYALLIAAWALVLISAARPVQIGDAITMPTSGRDLMLAIDVSESMDTKDMLIENQQLQRLLIVKYIVGEFLKKRKGDRLGLILFGTNAYLQSPLTFDLDTVNQYLQETTLGLAGGKTAIGDAIGLAVKRLKDRPESQRILILLTDGENTAGEILPRQAAELAAQAKVKIYTIGVGADSMRVSRGLFGARTVNPSASLDEGTLSYIAEVTGGQYFRARNPEELNIIYSKLEELEPIEQDAASYRPIRSLYYYPLILGLALLLLVNLMQLKPPHFLSSTFNKRSY